MRLKNDAYYTPNVEWVVDQLPMRLTPEDFIYEPCAGDLSMVRALEKRYGGLVCARDITNGFDATDEGSYPEHGVDWVITNPPFSQAFQILKVAHGESIVGVALHLRITFLEPTKTRGSRGEWLAENPPSSVVVLPRMSFTGKGSDLATCAWMIWEHGKTGTIRCAHRGIE